MPSTPSQIANFSIRRKFDIGRKWIDNKKVERKKMKCIHMPERICIRGITLGTGVLGISVYGGKERRLTIWFLDPKKKGRVPA
jgi:hypothetical protein